MLKMELTAKDRLERLAGDELPVHRATTPHLSALNPMFAEGGLVNPATGRKVLGLPIGLCGRNGSGGVFQYDPFELYKAGMIHNLNGVVLGEIDQRKSSLIKTMIYAAVAVGYNCMAIDPKGEYGPLADAIDGSKTLEFGADSAHINPLDPLIADDIQMELIASLAVTAMGGGRTELGVEERGLLDESIKDAKSHFGHGSRGVTTLPVVVDRLFNPTQSMADSLETSVDFLKEQARPIAMGLRRLTRGDLKGGVDQETTTGLLEDTPFLRIKCQDLSPAKAAITITLVNYFTSAQYGKSNSWGRFHWVFHDESWALAKYVAYVDSLRQSFKLGRSEGKAVWIVVHHLQNLYRSGHHEAIRDLIGDTDTKVIYKQNAKEIEESAQELELHSSLTSLIPQLSAGNAIWNVGKQHGIPVKHVVWPELLPLVETSQRAKGSEPSP